MQSSTIEFFARPVENTFGLAQHLYIVSTDSQEHKKILRAGPETDKGTGMLTDDLKVIYVVIWDRVNTLAFRRTL